MVNEGRKEETMEAEKNRRKNCPLLVPTAAAAYCRSLNLVLQYVNANLHYLIQIKLCVKVKTYAKQD